MEEFANIRLKTAAGNPVAIEAEWSEKLVATRLPVPDEWVERSSEWSLSAAEVLHVAAVLVDAGVLQYRLLPETPSLKVRLRFSRERSARWPDSPEEKEVRVSLESSACVVVSESLWTDPRTDVRVDTRVSV